MSQSTEMMAVTNTSGAEDVTEQQPTQQPAQPEGGLAAWCKVVGSFLYEMYFNTWGIATSFGVYQSHYQLYTLKSEPPSTISWIGTIQVFLLLFSAIIAGPLFDRGYGKTLLYTGCFMLVLGCFTLSVSRTLYQIMLSQGICIGIGCGLTFVPAVSIVAHVFTTKRPIALGLASTGSAVGGTIFPIIFKQLTPTIGLDWTNRVFGFMTLGISIIAILLLGSSHHEIEGPRNTSFLELSAFREPPYLFLVLGLFLVELGFWIPPFIIAPYAQLSLGTSAEYAFYLLAILNAGSFAGRTLPAFVAQMRTIGPAWTLVVGSLSLGILVLCWLSVHNVIGITIWAVFTGFMSGLVVSIPNTVITKLSTPTQLGTRSGMVWTIVALAALVGAPIANVLVDTSTNSYKWGQLFSGLSICAGSGMLCVPAVHIKRKRLD